MKKQWNSLLLSIVLYALHYLVFSGLVWIS